MIMKKKLWMLAIGAIVLAGVAITAMALPGARHQASPDGGMWGGGGKGMGHGGGMMNDQGMGILMLARFIDNPKVKTELGLTDAQVDAIKTKTQAAKDSAKGQRESLQAARKQLGDLVGAEKPDANLMDAKLDDIGRMQTQLTKQLIHAEIDIKAILTPDQLQKVKDFAAKMKEKRAAGGEGRGHGRGMGGPGKTPGADAPSTGN